jgi:hypothetical protein
MGSKAKVKLINEAVVQNEVNWGDSLIGRFINSAIRRGKIGYNLTKVDDLVQAIQRELDSLLAMGLQKEAKDKFISLYIRASFSELKKICKAAVPDSDKMDTLLGAHDDLWDETKPNGGMWKDNVSSGYLRRLFEDFDYNRTEEEFRNVELQGERLSKEAFLSNISIFIDNLRKLTSASTASNVQQQGYWQSNFGKVSAGLSRLIVASYQYNTPEFNHGSGYLVDKLTTFESFKEIMILEKGGEKFAAMTDDQFEDWIKSNPGGEDLARKLRKEALGQKKSITKTASNVVTNSNKQPLGVTASNKVATTSNPLKTQAEKIKNLANKVKDKDYDPKDSDIKALQNILINLKDEEIEYIDTKNKENPDFKKYIVDFRELIKKIKLDSDSTKKIEEKDTKTEKIKESVVLNFKKYKLFEDVSDGSVEKSFDDFAKDLPELLFEITQNEVDKLVKLQSVDSQKMIINIAKNPDPIIKITRIMQRAHDLCVTSVIPSGRSGGKVSNKTFREYIKLGKGSESKSADSDSPGYGPWAVAKFYNKFRDGVMKILEDQKYRKIFANVKFVVPGSEDTFNPSTKQNANFVYIFKDFVKVFEAETKEENNTKSHGMILFDFIQDMLDRESFGEFDTSRRTLLKKYFGQFGFNDKIIGKSSTPADQRPSPARRVVCDPNTIFWNVLSPPNMICEAVGSNVFKGGIYAIPIKNNNNGSFKVIFVHALQKIKIKNKDRYIIKFVFDHQEHLVTKLKDKINPQYTIPKNFSMDTSKQSNSKVFYGILEKVPTSGQFKIVYAQVTVNNTIGSVVSEEFEKQDHTTAGNPPENVVLSKLQQADANSNATDINTNFSEKLFSEKGSHKDNLDIQSGGKTLLEQLKDKADSEF